MADPRGVLFVRVRDVMDELCAQGKALRMLGPIAPPCLAVPYNAMRKIVYDAAVALYDDFMADVPEAAREEQARNLDPFIAAVADMPVITQQWDDGPKQWRRTPGHDGIVVPGAPVVVDLLPPRGMGQVDLPFFIQRHHGGPPEKWSWPLLRAAGWKIQEVGSAVYVNGVRYSYGGGFTFKDIAGRVVTAAAVGVMVAPLAGVGLVAGAIGGAAVLVIGETLGLGSMAHVLAAALAADIGPSAVIVADTLQAFETVYRPATIQQWRALDRCAKAAGGDPAKLVAAMRVVDPEKEDSKIPGEDGVPTPFVPSRAKPKKSYLWTTGIVFAGSIVVGEVVGS